MKSLDFASVLLVVAGLGIYLLMHVVAGHDPKTGIFGVFMLAAFVHLGSLKKRISQLESNQIIRALNFRPGAYRW